MFALPAATSSACNWPWKDIFSSSTPPLSSHMFVIFFPTFFTSHLCFSRCHRLLREVVPLLPNFLPRRLHLSPRRPPTLSKPKNHTWTSNRLEFERESRTVSCLTHACICVMSLRPCWPSLSLEDARRMKTCHFKMNTLTCCMIR